MLLHGVTMSARAWDPVTDLLAAHHDVLALSAPGHGGSPALPPGARYDPPTLAAAVLQAMDEVGWAPRTWPGTPWAAGPRWRWAPPAAR